MQVEYIARIPGEPYEYDEFRITVASEEVPEDTNLFAFLHSQASEMELTVMSLRAERQPPAPPEADGETPFDPYTQPSAARTQPQPTRPAQRPQNRPQNGSVINCPFCQGPTWDNRETAKGRQPLFKCRDKGCDAAAWEQEDRESGDLVLSWRNAAGEKFVTDAVG